MKSERTAPIRSFKRKVGMLMTATGWMSYNVTYSQNRLNHEAISTLKGFMYLNNIYQ